MPRFDEIDLEPVAFDVAPVAASIPEVSDSLSAPSRAPLARRTFALLVDLSLFAALTFSLSPLLPSPLERLALAALAGFVVMISFYYFVGTWMLWGRTIGGAIFDVRIVSDHAPAVSLRDASVRWLALYLSLATGGLGFLLALLPSRRSLADRLSHTVALRPD
jgi:uncharacterized RDD family membrane protein YckC